MSGSAIEAGQAFVKFFGDTSALMQAFKKIKETAGSAGTQISVAFNNQASNSLNMAADSASRFGMATNAAVAASTGLGALSVTVKNQSEGFYQLATAAGSAYVNLTKMPVPLAKIATYLSLGPKFLNSMGQIGRGAKMASWGLGFVSKALQNLGLETKQLDAMRAKLDAVGRKYIWLGRLIFAIKSPFLAAMTAGKLAAAGISLAWNAASKAIGLTAKQAKMAAGSFRGGSKLGMAASSVAMGAQATGEEGKPSASTAVGGGAMAGLMMGGVVGAAGGAALGGIGFLLAKALGDGAKQGADQADSVITKIGYKANAVFQWVGGIAGKAWESITSAMKRMGGEGESILSKIEKAIYPIVYAVENVWLPAFTGAVDYMASFFGKRSADMGNSWSDWIAGAIGNVADFIANFDIYFQIAQQSIAMWTTNGIVMVQDFFKNFGKLMAWAGSNWKNILFTMLDYGLTIFINLGENIRTLFEKIWNWVKSGFTGALDLKKEDFKGLTEGAHSAISDMPKIFTSELAKTTPEIEKLYDKLGERQKDIQEKMKGFEGLTYDAKTEAKKGGRDKGFSAISAQSQDAAKLIADATSPKNDPQVKEQKETNKNLKTLIGAVQSGFSKGAGTPSYKEFKIGQ